MKKIVIIPFLFITTICISATSGEIVWEFSTNERIYSSPLIHNNLVFFGSGDSTFYSLQKQTGELHWQFKADGAIHSDPTTTNGIVFFSTSKGSLYALGANDGSLKWKFESQGEKMLDIWDYYLSSPNVNNGIVYWGSGNGNLYAIDSKTGKLIWQFVASGIVHSKPIVSESFVFFWRFWRFLLFPKQIKWRNNLAVPNRWRHLLS